MFYLSSSGGDPQIDDRHGVIIPLINRLSSNTSNASPCGGETAPELNTEKELEPLRAVTYKREDRASSSIIT